MLPATLEDALSAATADSVYKVIPPGVIEALWRYVALRVPTGGFLTALLSNDLKEAVGRADHINIKILKEIVTYCYMELPSPCWGAPSKVDAWLAVPP